MLSYIMLIWFSRELKNFRKSAVTYVGHWTSLPPIGQCRIGGTNERYNARHLRLRLKIKARCLNEGHCEQETDS